MVVAEFELLVKRKLINMRKYLVFLLFINCIVFTSWTLAKSHLLNANSWSISIGKKEVLASWKNNKMGDTAVLFKKNLNPSDTVFTEQFWCGYSGVKCTTKLTITNSDKQIIKESIVKDNQWLSMQILLSDILNSQNIKNNGIAEVYFTVNNSEQNINQTAMLGVLVFK